MFVALIVFQTKALNVMPALANIGWLNVVAGSWVSL